MNNRNETIKEEFTKQARCFETVGLPLSNQKYLEWIVKSLPLKKRFMYLISLQEQYSYQAPFRNSHKK